MTNARNNDHDDLYSALGVPAGATDEEVTRADRRLAREHDPDANPGADIDAFAGITDAYDTLRDRPADAPTTTRDTADPGPPPLRRGSASRSAT
jgi:hypothetical protein